MDEKVFYEMMNNFDFTAALEPTASQQVLATLSGDVREALSAAYRTIKTATSAGLRPDFAAIQRDYFHRAPADMQRAVIDALRQYFDSATIELFLAPLPAPGAAGVAEGAVVPGAPVLPSTISADRLRGSPPPAVCSPVTASSSTSRDDTIAPPPQQPASPSRSGTGSYDGLSNVAPGSIFQSPPPPSGPSGPLASPPAESASSTASPSSPLSLRGRAMSKRARENMAAIAAGGHPPWEYAGVFRWSKGSTTGPSLSLQEIEAEETLAAVLPAHHDRAARFPLLRERWCCSACGTVRHEKVGRTANLAKHGHQDTSAPPPS
ncbi:unnamed protein product [Tilletia controversa]|uniref:Uncharacterized protein n=3 Tax=Tilletia TaxID=13289 RepID=A0A8T8T5T5_9BASI|nr:hypothetical protein A4X03_0g5609 [Tilletia caries]CAD6936526.1 unnamed protein product [Tilletia controversa]CAD6967445.1 unnamed protein product [Tilletia controversa]